MSLTLQQLQVFCSTDETRTVLQVPFSDAFYTYATDRRIIVRVPLWPDVTATGPNAAKVCEHIPADWTAIKLVKLPEPLPPIETEVCESCGGGEENKKGCDECDGKGFTNKTTFYRLGNRCYQPFYLHKIATLPDVVIAPDYGMYPQPLRFKFTGGVGLLMPMRVFE